MHTYPRRSGTGYYIGTSRLPGRTILAAIPDTATGPHAQAYPIECPSCVQHSAPDGPHYLEVDDDCDAVHPGCGLRLTSLVTRILRSPAHQERG